MALQDKLIDALGRFATTFNSYRYIMAIKSAFITLMPVIIVGAFSVLISNMVLDPKNGLASFSSLSFLAALKPITSALNYATLNFLNIGAVFLIGIELGRINGIKSLFPGLLAVICFICVTPTTVEMMVDGQMHVVKDVLLRQFSDTRSLFLGMFIAISVSGDLLLAGGAQGTEDQNAGYRAAERLCLFFRADPGDHHHHRDRHLWFSLSPADGNVSLRCGSTRWCSSRWSGWCRACRGSCC
ncbi:putative PTS family enzyme IIC component [Klebsiella pneumoniae]|nr:putative PTS family enzyme IIC component [Klebsiella pneumoniae]